jgi:hypothetical protein
MAYDGEILDEIEADFYEKGLTDGLPIIPPTRERVEAMVKFNNLDPNAVIGAIPPRNGIATIEKIAANAVMAGCANEYLPVVIAAVEGLTAPGFDLFGLQATTHPAALAVFISGPISKTLNINSGTGALGPGWRANATIGRAVRLIALNLGGAKPGPVDKSTQGSPAKYGFCFAENQDENPWDAFHVERGFKADDSCVTVLGLEGPHNINGQDSLTADDLLRVIANSIISMGSCNFRFTTGSDLFIALGPEHAHILGREGVTKKAIREYLFKHARVSIDRVPQEHIAHRLKTPAQYGEWDGKSDIRIVKAPENFLLTVVGGPGLHSCWMPNWGGPNHQGMTKRIRTAR